MEISQKGIDLIKHFEGCRLSAYRCPAGILTIGYGHTGKSVYSGLIITQEQAEMLLKKDISAHANYVSRLVKVPLNQNQFDALVSFEFNVGCGNFGNSTLLKLLNQSRYNDAANQFTRWKYAGGRICLGLEKRRIAEKELFLT